MKTTPTPSLPPAVGPGHRPTYHIATDGVTLLYGDINDPEIVGRLESHDIMAVENPAKHRAFIVHACNTSAANEARIAALARDLSDAEIELRLCSELLGDYARGAVNDHAETFRRIGVASTVIANARSVLASVQGIQA